MDVRVDIFAVCTDLFTALYVSTIISVHFFKEAGEPSTAEDVALLTAFFGAPTQAPGAPTQAPISPPGSTGKSPLLQAPVAATNSRGPDLHEDNLWEQRVGALTTPAPGTDLCRSCRTPVVGDDVNSDGWPGGDFEEPRSSKLARA